MLNIEKKSIFHIKAIKYLDANTYAVSLNDTDFKRNNLE